MTLETPQDSNKKFVKQDWNRAKKNNRIRTPPQHR